MALLKLGLELHGIVKLGRFAALGLGGPCCRCDGCLLERIKRSMLAVHILRRLKHWHVVWRVACAMVVLQKQMRCIVLRQMRTVQCHPLLILGLTLSI